MKLKDIKVLHDVEMVFTISASKIYKTIGIRHSKSSD